MWLVLFLVVVDIRVWWCVLGGLGAANERERAPKHDFFYCLFYHMIQYHGGSRSLSKLYKV
jgi:hypothetical protein